MLTNNERVILKILITWKLRNTFLENIWIREKNLEITNKIKWPNATEFSRALNVLIFKKERQLIKGTKYLSYKVIKNNQIN